MRKLILPLSCRNEKPGAPAQRRIEMMLNKQPPMSQTQTDPSAKLLQRCEYVSLLSMLAFHDKLAAPIGL